MLTGDNGVTAKEIGISSGILDDSEKNNDLIELDENIE
jgi:magnesium-transporting ATPase (P-type)